MHDPLLTAIAGSHRALDDQLTAVGRAVQDRQATRVVMQMTDAFMIHACRHVSATCAVILPRARRGLPEGRRRVRLYIRQARQLERSVAQAKRRLYGASRSIELPWSYVWAGLRHELHELMAIELALVEDVAAELGPRAGGHLARQLAGSEAGSPTRPHPHSPHTGWTASLSRVLWVRADSFWDAVEGRIVAGAVKRFKAPARFAS
ncbi:hypothetical protein [Aeromicrobium sp. 9AM]|uniref:hypothetical protein n=1 Tax=Aeromicrobium sp. 9AM TaxID=2653126 RepID=UPI0012F38015|nr:hypothetical protein [Aeromicrobium sp. 9AM]VXC34129.1 conserved hypothetical protein [Aeromicrobium sp. 9AM]